jgi:hypothetical protein
MILGAAIRSPVVRAYVLSHTARLANQNEGR